MFEPDVYLLTRGLAERLKAPAASETETPAGGADISDGLAGGSTGPGPGPDPDVPVDPQPPMPPAPSARKAVHIRGDIPPEIWNRLGTRLLPKLRSGRDLKVGVAFELTTDGAGADSAPGGPAGDPGRPAACRPHPDRRRVIAAWGRVAGGHRPAGTHRADRRDRATCGIPEQAEETDRSEAPARPGSSTLPIALCLAGAFLLAAFLGSIPWAIAAAGGALSGLAAGI